MKHGISTLFNLKKIKEWYRGRGVKHIDKNEEDYIDWGLGIEVPFFSSSKFTVENNAIAIIGSQITHDRSWPIKYSIVKISKLGTSIKYFESVIFYGDQFEGEFHHKFHLPNGSGYQLLVFNYFQYHSIGRLRLIQTNEQKENEPIL
ncbi:hypothetical protein ACIQXV_14640 [Neobacillus sp. NPDC097160]|uniref:hypothetical protein n=1 Tax=Neobacillus sp. NPDC097160 TaxID=3364298 RepID=UPI0038214388